MAKTSMAGSAFDSIVDLVDEISQKIPDKTYMDILNNLGLLYEQITDEAIGYEIDGETLTREQFIDTYEKLSSDYRSYIRHQTISETRAKDEIKDLKNRVSWLTKENSRLENVIKNLSKLNDNQSKTIKELIDKPYLKPVVKAVAKPIVKAKI